MKKEKNFVLTSPMMKEDGIKCNRDYEVVVELNNIYASVHSAFLALQKGEKRVVPNVLEDVLGACVKLSFHSEISVEEILEKKLQAKKEVETFCIKGSN